MHINTPFFFNFDRQLKRTIATTNTTKQMNVTDADAMLPCKTDENPAKGQKIALLYNVEHTNVYNLSVATCIHYRLYNIKCTEAVSAEQWSLYSAAASFVQ